MFIFKRLLSKWIVCLLFIYAYIFLFIHVLRISLIIFDLNSNFFCSLTLLIPSWGHWPDWVPIKSCGGTSTRFADSANFFAIVQNFCRAKLSDIKRDRKADIEMHTHTHTHTHPHPPTHTHTHGFVRTAHKAGKHLVYTVCC